MSQIIGSQKGWDFQTAQAVITEQHELIQRSLHVHSHVKIKPGIPPLEANNIVVSGNSIDRLESGSTQVAGWAVVWANSRLPISGSCHDHTCCSDLYFELMALKEAIRATPDNQSITIIANTTSLIYYMKHNTLIVKGKDIVGEEYKIFEPLLEEIESLRKRRSGKVEAVMIYEDPSWLVQAKDSAKVIAVAEQRELRWSLMNSVNNVSSSDKVDSTVERKKEPKKWVLPFKASGAGRRFFTQKAQPDPQPLISEAHAIRSSNEHTLPFISVLTHDDQTTSPSTQCPHSKENASLSRAKADTGKGSSKTGGTGSDIRECTQKRQAEDPVSMEPEINKKQKPLASDTEDSDVYEDAVEHFDRVV